ncbi:MAG: pyrimidine-nucleoside phosphorylase, partial [Peptostreptococcus sp.]|nr:pyrimidine-nucleoside phosphorylase [Peptostreptococcus sp.]
GPKDFTELCMCAGEIMLMQGELASNKEEARKMLEEAISSGKAYEKLIQMVKAQGGNIEQIKDTKLLPQSKFVTEMKSKEAGFVHNIHSQQLGILAMHLGAGRATKDDPINYAVGLKMNSKKGDRVEVGDLLCTVYHDEPLKDEWVEMFYNTFSFGDEKVDPIPIVEAILD